MNNVKSHIAIMSLLQSFKKHQNMRIARQRNHFVRNSSLFLFATVSNCSVLFLSILIACLIGLCKKTITWEMLAEIRKYSFIFRYQSQPGRGQLLLFHCVNEKKAEFCLLVLHEEVFHRSWPEPNQNHPPTFAAREAHITIPGRFDNRKSDKNCNFTSFPSSTSTPFFHNTKDYYSRIFPNIIILSQRQHKQREIQLLQVALVIYF